MKTQTALALSLAILSLGTARAVDYEIEPSHSFVNFNLSHMKVGKAHGRFSDFSGTVNYSPKSVDASTLEFTIKAASVDTGNKKRDAHLLNRDFFDVVQFPTITFKSKSVSAGKITGDLTMMGVTKEIEVGFSVAGIGMHLGAKKEILGATATFSINRSDFGMKYGLPDAIGDVVEISVSIEALKK
jgi:polyisoprenoid-binding protein YceI